MSKKVFIDPGHGGSDPGASGNGLTEKVVNLNVALLVKNQLERHGVTVYMSRTNDASVSLSQRTNEANRLNADCLLSIHCNAFNGNAYGAETYCYKFQYRKLADCIQNEIISAKLYNHNRGVKEGNLHMVRESTMSAALVEMAFIDHAGDSQLLRNKQDEFAVALAKGILRYLGIAWKDGSVSQPSQPSGALYRVRKTWADVASQKGAFSDLNNAKKCANENPGYSVFDASGNNVYSQSAPSFPDIDVWYRVYSGGRWWPEVKNLTDYAGVYGNAVRCVMARPSSGTIEYRVSPVWQNYYPWVRNYNDFAGLQSTNIDRLQMRLVGMPGYQIKYRVKLVGGDYLPWVYGDSDFAGIQGRIIDAVQILIIKK